MLRKRFFTIIVPVSTFIFGILVQVLLSNWITFTNIIPISIVVILIFLATIALILELIDKRFEDVDKQLIDIASRIGLRAYYVEDGEEGKSYKASTDLIENAKLSLVAVGIWEPFSTYKADKFNIKDGNSEVIRARNKFYEAIKKQVEQHQNDEAPFYRRIVQVPEEYVNKKVPFETDSVFYKHLSYIASIQNSGSRACILRKTSVFINLHFTLVDNQHIIIPILTTVKKEIQARYGAIIIDDTQGELVRRLQAIYWTIENRAKPIELSELNT